MGIATDELPGGIIRVILEGSLDITGASAIDMQMNIIAGSRKAVLIDLANVTFIGSMGLRSLVLPARAIKNHGGKIALLNPNENVAQVLKTSGIDALLPVYHDLETATAALQ
jgi:anti-anti-sigma factor